MGQVRASTRDLNGLTLETGQRESTVPKVQVVDREVYTSEPTTMISTAAMDRLGLQPITTGWLIRSATPLTSAQISAARRIAADAGLTIETRSTDGRNGALGADATAIGLLIAPAVLAVTVGLIRSETAGDMRTLTAAGAGTDATLARGHHRGRPRAARCSARHRRSASRGARVEPRTSRFVGSHSRVELAHPDRRAAVGGRVAGWVLAGRTPRGIARAALT